MTEICDYMPAPKESLETIRKFVEHGNARGGEYSFVREELAELIRAVERYERLSYMPEMMPRSVVDDIKNNLIEEIAHVYLVLNHLRWAANVPTKFIQNKMDEKIWSYGFDIYEEGKRNGA